MFRMILVGLAFAAIGAGITAGIMVWEPFTSQESLEATRTPSLTPTPYQRRLTGAEAAVTLEKRINDSWGEEMRKQWNEGLRGLRSLSLLENCKTVDFNEMSRAWIIQCTNYAQTVTLGDRIELGARVELGIVIYRMFDETGKYERVGP